MSIILTITDSERRTKVHHTIGSVPRFGSLSFNYEPNRPNILTYSILEQRASNNEIEEFNGLDFQINLVKELNK